MLVTTFAELLLALAMREPDIIIANDIEIINGLVIDYNVTIRGVDPSVELFRSVGFTGIMFNVTASGTLNLQDITIDGSNVTASPMIRSFGFVNIINASLQNATSFLQGSAIDMEANTTNLTNVQVANCTSTANGGALYAGGASTFTIANSNLINNVAGQNGGAIFINSSSQIECINTVFNNNRATVAGGVVFANLDTTLEFRDCRFNFNESGDGGAIFINPRSELIVAGGEFVANTSRLNGGAIYLNAESTGSIISNFRNNFAQFGAGIFVNNTARMGMAESTFIENEAIFGGGGVFFNGFTAGNVSNCTFLSQRASQGAAMFINNQSPVDLSNCTFTENVANDDGGALFVNDTTVNGSALSFIRNVSNVAGAIFNNGTLTLQNTQFLENEALLQGGAIRNNGTLNFLVFSQFEQNDAPDGAGIYNAGTLNVQGIVREPNNFFIESIDNVIRVTGPLLNGTVFQLEVTPYVFPDPERSPIVVGVPTESYPILTETDRQTVIKPVSGFEDWTVELLNNQIVLVFNPTPTFTITYVDVFGDNPNPSTYQPSDLPIVLQAPQSPPGLEFIGWFDANGNQVDVIPIGTTGDLVLFARYREVPVVSGNQILQNSVRVRCCKTKR
ncbi:hypothetical protein [Geomicrobium sp. JCM 19038]|uniref:hypothetical protein n=1 Tax=Geomicrobium sp. JCM 19038 TaxID=1460635 RepID=UPI00045F3F09|nr:hypothetical protein [Geomicrobium sp. JCM 19038]GAK09110.1 hypothetical protein JCM19038_2928 [Geomicrobium sp. JCM 19038]